MRLTMAGIAIVVLASACGSSGGAPATSSSRAGGPTSSAAAYRAGMTEGTMNWTKLVSPTVSPATKAGNAVVKKSCGKAYAAAPNAPTDKSEWIRGCVDGAIVSFTKGTS